jgi:PAS domain S-box-containing protein
MPAATADGILTHLSTIGRMTLAMSRATRPEELYVEALAAVTAIAGTERVSIALLEPTGRLRYTLWRHLSDQYRAAVEGAAQLPPGATGAEPVLLTDPDEAPGMPGVAELLRQEGLRSMGVFPLLTGGATLGKIGVYYPERHVFGAEEVQLLQNVAACTAFAIDRLRSADALRHEEERYRSVVDHLKEVVFQTDAAGGWTFLNPSWEEVTGFPVAESLGRCFLDYVHPDDRARNQALFEPLIERRKSYCRHEIRYLHRAGGFRWIEVFARLTLGPGDEIVGTSGTLTDVTERRATAEALRDAEARLRETQRLESLGVLAGGIAHDFNNLLMGMLGNASIALGELSPDSPARGPIEDVVLAARRAADLTRQLLAYSGRGKFVLEALDLSSLVQESAQLLGAAISRKATVYNHFRAGLPAVEGDATQLRQVAMNLLANASDALDDRPGVITLRTDLVEADRTLLDRAIHGPALAPGPFVVLEVRDSGRGMDAATARRMFDPFFTTKARGHGLGLAAVLGIVRGHGGAIQVESGPGQGTSIRVLLPPARRAGATAGPAEPAPARGVRATVLLVDDEELVRRAAGRMLERSGCRVVVAENGRRALEVLGERGAEVDLVMLDLTMPELSGEETLAHLRARWPDLPVLLTSGFTEAARPAGPGPTAFLQKPFEASQLEGMVRRALESRAAGA